MPCNMNVLTVFVEHREFNVTGQGELGRKSCRDYDRRDGDRECSRCLMWRT